MLYDFHVHTSEYSHCAVSSAEEVCRKAVELGLSGIALTEHDIWRPASEIKNLRQRFPELIIISGMEYACPEEHFLVYLPAPENTPLPTWYGVLDLIPAVRHLGGIVIWAHPFRYNNTWPRWLDAVRPDGMEIASSNMGSEAQIMSRNAAMRMGLMMFRNSDAHHADLLGRYHNRLEISLNSVEDFIGYVKSYERQQETKAAVPASKSCRG